MDKFNDDFIADAIIKSEILMNKHKDIIEKIKENKFEIEEPKSDLDPYYIFKLNNIKLKASYIGDSYKNEDNPNKVYLKWSWSNAQLNKASKVNLLKILKYFLDREPNENSPIFNLIYTAFIQSIIQIDEKFNQVLFNALLHLMKHLFFIGVVENNITKIYFIKEIL